MPRKDKTNKFQGRKRKRLLLTRFDCLKDYKEMWKTEVKFWISGSAIPHAILDQHALPDMDLGVQE